MKLPGTDILHWRYMASYLELLKSTEEIPTVRAIYDLEVYRGIERNIAPATVSKLISRLPRLSRLTAALSDPLCPQYQVNRNPENLFMEPPMDEVPQDEFPDDYRTAPSPLLNKMYTAAAYAAQHVPKLQTMDLIGQAQPGLNDLWKYRILSCELKHHYDHSQGRVSWVGTSLFPLSDETREAWDGIKEIHGHSQLNSENIVEVESISPQMASPSNSDSS